MINILIRQAVSPDIELLMGFDHGVKSNTVWQMNQNVTNGEVTTSFTESYLPREMRLAYPRNTQILQDCWHFFSCVLVACVDKVPVGYITVSTHFSTSIVWVKDLVVDEFWRRKGVASALFYGIRDWGLERKYSHIMLEMSSKNSPAICFARKHGFEFAGFNDNYFNNNDIALFFSRLLK